jgi:hypothetical protein
MKIMHSLFYLILIEFLALSCLTTATIAETTPDNKIRTKTELLEAEHPQNIGQDAIIVRNVHVSVQGEDLVHAKETAIDLMLDKARKEVGASSRISPWFEVSRERIGDNVYEIVADVGFTLGSQNKHANPWTRAGLVRISDEPQAATQSYDHDNETWGIVATAIRDPDGSIRLWNKTRTGETWNKLGHGAMRRVGSLLIAPPDRDAELANLFESGNLDAIQSHYKGAFSGIAIWDPSEGVILISVLRQNGERLNTKALTDDRRQEVLDVIALQGIRSLVTARSDITMATRSANINASDIQTLSPTITTVRLPETGADQVFNRLRLASFDHVGIGVHRDGVHVLIEGETPQQVEKFLKAIGLE